MLICILLVKLNWQDFLECGRYSMKLAAFGPVGSIGGLFLILFPTMAGKPESAKEKIIVMAVFGIGLLAGLINWYMMDPGFFVK
jgi:hypothetical protein